MWSGRNYRGEFVNGVKEGKGVDTFRNGTVTMEGLEMEKEMDSAPRRLFKAITPASG